jgi:hypothetical protein
MYDSYDAEEMIKYALEDMNVYGYDFGYSKYLTEKRCKRMKKKKFISNSDA